MTPTASPSNTKPGKQRLSTLQMLHLMRLEVGKALRHAYPISCVVIGLDGFGEAEAGHRKHLMPEIFRQLKEVTFEEKVEGLGIFTEQYVLATFPHVNPDQLAEIAKAMLLRAGRVENPSAFAKGPLTLSVGIAHNLHQGDITFESLVEEAETGMGLAQAGGGNRYIQANEVESEIDRLKEELDAQIQTIAKSQEEFFQTQADLENDWSKNLINLTLELFKREPEQTEGMLRLQKEVIAMITQEVKAWRSNSNVQKMLAGMGEIDRLERRVAKLTHSLGVTEEELKRVAAMKNIDVGIASLYRNVQGLNGEDDGRKVEMLKDIFEANLALKNEIASK